MPLLLIPLALMAVMGLYVLVQYNQLISLQNHIRNAWSNIDTELKRRYELIPNLVATVKGYAKHEREVLEQVTVLRKQCLASKGSPSQQASDERHLVSALQRLMVVVENYPDLKANQNFLQLQRELVNTEDRIQAARRFFNGNVQDYTTKMQMFPSNMIASVFQFQPHSYFTVEAVVRESPRVDLN